MSAQVINKQNFEEFKNQERPILLDFYASWCGPCRTVLPIIDEIASERADIAVGKINVDDEPELASEFKVMSIPTLVVIKNGKIVNQSRGAQPKNRILSLLES